MDALNGILNNPMIRAALLWAVGYALKKWPDFTNKAIPMALTICSAAVSVLQFIVSLFVGVAHAQGAVTIPLPQPHQPWWQYVLVSVLLPVIMAVGAHSAAKNTVQMGKGR